MLEVSELKEVEGGYTCKAKISSNTVPYITVGDERVHYTENITAEGASSAHYDIVGPICESSDVFAKDYALPSSQRGDVIVFRSAGAYGEVMASTYNCRTLPQTFTTEQILNK